MILITPDQYFSSILEKHFNSYKMKIDDDIKKYLISFLIKYIDSKNLKYKTLFEIYEKCIYENKIEHFKDLAEQSLFISGLFPNSIKRSLLNISYYVEMGSLGYGHLSKMSRSKNDEKVFFELSKNFQLYMNSFYLITKDSVIKDQLFLIETYLETKNPEIFQDLYKLKSNKNN